MRSKKGLRKIFFFIHNTSCSILTNFSRIFRHVLVLIFFYFLVKKYQKFFIFHTKTKFFEKNLFSGSVFESVNPNLYLNVFNTYNPWLRIWLKLKIIRKSINNQFINILNHRNIFNTSGIFVYSEAISNLDRFSKNYSLSSMISFMLILSSKIRISDLQKFSHRTFLHRINFSLDTKMTCIGFELKLFFSKPLIFAHSKTERHFALIRARSYFSIFCHFYPTAFRLSG